LTSLSELEIDELIVSVSTENNDYSGENSVKGNSAEVRSLEENILYTLAVCHNTLNAKKNNNTDDGYPNTERGEISSEIHLGGAEHMGNDVEGIGEILRTEEYPGEGYKRKGEENCQRLCEPWHSVKVRDLQELILDGLDKAGEDYVNTVEEAPNGICVACAVPYAAYGESNHLVKYPTGL